MVSINTETGVSATATIWSDFLDRVTSHTGTSTIWAELPNLDGTQMIDLMTRLRRIPYEVCVSVIQDVQGNRHSFCTTDFSADSVGVSGVYAYAKKEFPGFTELLRVHNHPDIQYSPDLDPYRIRQSYPSAQDLDGASTSIVNLVVHGDGVTMYSLPKAIKEIAQSSPGWVVLGDIFGVYAGLLFKQLGVDLSSGFRKSLRRDFPDQGTNQLLMMYTLGTQVRKLTWGELAAIARPDFFPGTELADSMQPMDLETVLDMCVDPRGIEIQSMLAAHANGERFDYNTLEIDDEDLATYEACSLNLLRSAPVLLRHGGKESWFTRERVEAIFKSHPGGDLLDLSFGDEDKSQVMRLLLDHVHKTGSSAHVVWNGQVISLSRGDLEKILS